MGYAAVVICRVLSLVVVITIFVISGLVAIGVWMTLALCMVRATRVGSCMTQRDGWEEKDCCD